MRCQTDLQFRRAGQTLSDTYIIYRQVSKLMYQHKYMPSVLTEGLIDINCLLSILKSKDTVKKYINTSAILQNSRWE